MLGNGTDPWEPEAVVWLGEYAIERATEGACSACDGGGRAQFKSIPWDRRVNELKLEDGRRFLPPRKAVSGSGDGGITSGIFAKINIAPEVFFSKI